MPALAGLAEEASVEERWEVADLVNHTFAVSASRRGTLRGWDSGEDTESQVFQAVLDSISTKSPTPLLSTVRSAYLRHADPERWDLSAEIKYLEQRRAAATQLMGRVQREVAGIEQLLREKAERLARLPQQFCSWCSIPGCGDNMPVLSELLLCGGGSCGGGRAAARLADAPRDHPPSAHAARSSGRRRSTHAGGDPDPQALRRVQPANEREEQCCRASAEQVPQMRGQLQAMERKLTEQQQQGEQTFFGRNSEVRTLRHELDASPASSPTELPAEWSPGGREERSSSTSSNNGPRISSRISSNGGQGQRGSQELLQPEAGAAQASTYRNIGPRASSCSSHNSGQGQRGSRELLQPEACAAQASMGNGELLEACAASLGRATGHAVRQAAFLGWKGAHSQRAHVDALSRLMSSGAASAAPGVFQHACFISWKGLALHHAHRREVLRRTIMARFSHHSKAMLLRAAVVWWWQGAKEAQAEAQAREALLRAEREQREVGRKSAERLLAEALDPEILELGYELRGLRSRGAESGQQLLTIERVIAAWVKRLGGEDVCLGHTRKRSCFPGTVFTPIAASAACPLSPCPPSFEDDAPRL